MDIRKMPSKDEITKWKIWQHVFIEKLRKEIQKDE